MLLPRKVSRSVAVGLLVLSFSPALAKADDAVPVDARLQGYRESMAPADPASTTLTWLALVGLGVVGMGTLFMSAKRSHLD